MKLSIVIVSYNVSAFLENTLLSVKSALRELEAEIFVVDNDSADNSVYMVSRKFPEVHLIANPDNVGFSKANNQAMRIAKGEYILLLNPDTIVSEDTLTKCVDFMDAHPDAGAVGVKLADGSGTYLPESKRGFPTPFAAFCKMSGLSALFPRSSVFNHYYLGHLENDKTHQVEVLCGAFMFLRSSALKKSGLLDEEYFMYGEDIDLSYRLLQSNYKNYYYPETSIIHYKGESTQKSSLRYVNMFYQAMFIFLKKHYKQKTGSPFLVLIKIGILTKAFLGSLRRIMSIAGPVVLDALVIVTGLVVLKGFWSHFYFQDPLHFDSAFTRINIPLYTFLWVFFLYVIGSYDEYYSRKRAFIGVLIGTIVILSVYAVLPLSLRSSRAIILLGAIWTFASILMVRLAGQTISSRRFSLRTNARKRTLIVGRKESAQRIMELINRANAPIQLIGCVTPENQNTDPDFYLNTMQKLHDLVNLYKVQELIFSARDIPFSKVSQIMSETGPGIEYKIASDESYAIVGSRSKDTSGELYTVDIQFKIDNPIQKRYKRIFDILVSIGLILCSPVLIFSIKRKLGFFKNCYWILINRKTWIGYNIKDLFLHDLPKIKTGVLPPMHTSDLEASHTQSMHMSNFIYAKEYSIWKDFEILANAIPDLGRQTL